MLTLIYLVLINRWKETDKIMLRTVISKLVLLLNTKNNREINLLKENRSVFAGEKIIYRYCSNKIPKMMTRFVLKKAKFYQGCRCSFMNLLKMNTFRSIFDHISEHKFKAVSFSKKLAADISGFCNSFPMWNIAFTDKERRKEEGCLK